MKRCSLLWWDSKVGRSGVEFNTRLDDPLKHPSRCPSRERPCTNFFPLPLDGKSKQSFWIEKRLKGTFRSKNGLFPQLLKCPLVGGFNGCFVGLFSGSSKQTPIESGPNRVKTQHYDSGDSTQHILFKSFGLCTPSGINISCSWSLSSSLHLRDTCCITLGRGRTASNKLEQHKCW